MLSDGKMKLAIFGFMMFFIIWSFMAIKGSAPIEPFVDFIKVSTGTAFGLVLAFIKPHDEEPKKTDEPLQ